MVVLVLKCADGLVSRTTRKVSRMLRGCWKLLVRRSTSRAFQESEMESSNPEGG